MLKNQNLLSIPFMIRVIVCLIVVLLFSLLASGYIHVRCADISCSADNGCFAEVVTYSGCVMTCTTGSTHETVDCGHKMQ